MLEASRSACLRWLMLTADWRVNHYPTNQNRAWQKSFYHFLLSLAHNPHPFYSPPSSAILNKQGWSEVGKWFPTAGFHQNCFLNYLNMQVPDLLNPYLEVKHFDEVLKIILLHSHYWDSVNCQLLSYTIDLAKRDSEQLLLQHTLILHRGQASQEGPLNQPTLCSTSLPPWNSSSPGSILGAGYTGKHPCPYGVYNLVGETDQHTCQSSA